MKIYVASSWRNKYQPAIVKRLTENGFDVYDFRNPPNKSGFGWEQINEHWKDWSLKQYKNALNHPLAVEGFISDYKALCDADACVLVLPSGRSSHIEAGVMAGLEKFVVVFSPEACEPELMYKTFDYITDDLLELIEVLMRFQNEGRGELL